VPDHILQSVVLRSLQQARYSAENVGHFGLAYDLYTHFTSPIRRYSDLIVHRMIRARLQKKAYHSVPKLQEICDHLCVTERQADEASRRVVSTLKCDYAVKFLGQIFEGVITGVTRFGFFVQLAELYIDGLVHVSNLHDDYYNFDEVRQVLHGELTNRAFMLGQNVRVMVVRVDALAGKIDLDVVESPTVPFVPEPRAQQNYSEKRAEKKSSQASPHKKKSPPKKKAHSSSKKQGKGWMDHEEISI
jgi:ribonuclease R